MNIALSGGGVKGFAYVGVLKFLEEHGIKEKRISGTSVGALFGLLITLGYSSKELEHIVMNLDLNFLEEVNIGSILKKFGANSWRKVSTLVNFMIKHKGFDKKVTFKELYILTGIHLSFTCWSLIDSSGIVFDYILTPDYNVSLACRQSMCVPFIWEPINGSVDGCLYRNLPIEQLHIKNTVGFYFLNMKTADVDTNIGSYTVKIMKQLIAKGNSLEIKMYELIGYKLIGIPVKVQALSFNIDSNDKRDLIMSGYLRCVELKEMFGL